MCINPRFPLHIHTLTHACTQGIYLVDGDIALAFTKPGGEIFLFTGLNECVKTEADLAGVIAHEMSHGLLQHVRIHTHTYIHTHTHTQPHIYVRRAAEQDSNPLTHTLTHSHTLTHTHI